MEEGVKRAVIFFIGVIVILISVGLFCNIAYKIF
jgi:uncharacterized membrane protein